MQAMKPLDYHFHFGRNYLDFKHKFSIEILYSIFFSPRFPFNWQNPIGYIFAAIFEYIVCTYAYLAVFSEVFFGIGCCLFVVTIITKNFESDLKFINKNVTSDPNHVLTLNLVKNFIQNHSMLKKFSIFFAPDFMPFKFINSDFNSRFIDDFSNLYQIPFVILFVWSLVTICSALLLIQMEIV